MYYFLVHLLGPQFSLHPTKLFCIIFSEFQFSKVIQLYDFVKTFKSNGPIWSLIEWNADVDSYDISHSSFKCAIISARYRIYLNLHRHINYILNIIICQRFGICMNFYDYDIVIITHACI